MWLRKRGLMLLLQVEAYTKMKILKNKLKFTKDLVGMLMFLEISYNEYFIFAKFYFILFMSICLNIFYLKNLYFFLGGILIKFLKRKKRNI